MYEKIVNCITDGKCPHVDAAPYNYVTESKIYGIHIAAAVGTEEVVLGYRDKHKIGPVGLFGINPIHMTVLKNQSDMLRQLLHIYPQSPYKQFFFYSFRKSKTSCKIQVEHVPLIEVCTRKDSAELLRTFLCESPAVLGISAAFKYTFRHNMKVLQDALLDFKDKYQTEGRRICEAAIIFNDPKVLDRILKHLSTLYDFNNDQKHLYSVCSRLQREECLKFLSSYGHQLEQANESDERYVEYMIGLLASYHDRLKDDIVPVLKQNPSTAAIMNSADRYRQSQFHLYLRKEFPRLDTGLMNSLFELGADINVLYAEKQSALHHLLSLQATEPSLFYPKVRTAIEVFLNRNPELELYRNLKPEMFKTSPTGLAATIDLRLHLTPCILDLSGALTIDGNMHTYSGHESTVTYALNFFVPLLIECGMPYTKELLHDAPTKCLHPVEQEYSQLSLSRLRLSRITAYLEEKIWSLF